MSNTTPKITGIEASFFSHRTEVGVGCAVLLVLSCVGARLRTGGIIDESLVGLVFISGLAGYAMVQSVILLMATFRPEYLKQMLSEMRQMIAIAAMCLLLIAFISWFNAIQKASLASSTVSTGSKVAPKSDLSRLPGGENNH